MKKFFSYLFVFFTISNQFLYGMNEAIYSLDDDDQVIVAASSTAPATIKVAAEVKKAAAADVADAKLPDIESLNTHFANLSFKDGTFSIKKEDEKTASASHSIGLYFANTIIGSVDYAILVSHKTCTPGLYIHNIKISNSKYHGFGLGYLLALASCIDSLDHLKLLPKQQAFVTAISAESLHLFRNLGFVTTPGLDEEHLTTPNVEIMLQRKAHVVLKRSVQKLKDQIEKAKIK